jgi:MoxR-like ATPase
MSIGESMQQQAEAFRNRYTSVKDQIGRVIVGHDDIVHGVLTSMFIGGHCLLEGVPGLGKTLLVRTLSEALNLHFNRIQFTPDLMPSDILGTNMINENAEGRRVFEFQKGPIFTQICLADEINRATPKTQSALLETMQEGTVTVAGVRYELEKPFFVRKGPIRSLKPSSIASCSSSSSVIAAARSSPPSSIAQPKASPSSPRR